MRGPEHYVEAERLTDAYKSAITDAEGMPVDTVQQQDERYIACANARSLLDKALVHATLANASAVIAAGVGETFPANRELEAWQQTICAAPIGASS